MTRTMINITVSAVVFLLVLAVSICVFNLEGEQNAKLSLRTFPSGDGWGYEIRLNERCLIYQSVMPAVDSLRPFPSESSARQVGGLVLMRMVSHQPFAVSAEEVAEALDE